MVVESWVGKTPDRIAQQMHCHPQTVRLHVARFNQQGIEGLGVQPGSGRKPRLTEAERSIIVALPSQPPPGRLVRQRDGTMVARDETGRLNGAQMRWRSQPKRRAFGETQPDPPYPAARGRTLAPDAQLGDSRDKDCVQKDGGRHPLHRATSGIDDESRTGEGRSAMDRGGQTWVGDAGRMARVTGEIKVCCTEGHDGRHL